LGVVDDFFQDQLFEIKEIENGLNIFPTDNAMSAEQPKYGGIDFNAANLNMQIKRDGNGVALPVSQQNLENIRIDGLIPIILDIKPAVGILNLI
jgi:hypothetical protein